MNENQAANEADKIVFVTEPSQVLQDAILESKRSRHESDLDDCHDAGEIWSFWQIGWLDMRISWGRLRRVCAEEA